MLVGVINGKKFLLCFAVLLLITLYQILTLSNGFKIENLGWQDALIANQTLGVGISRTIISRLCSYQMQFQKIIAISSENVNATGSWRQRGLIAAAKRTELVIEIAQTGDLPRKEVSSVRRPRLDALSASEGSARAWAAHLRILRKSVNGSIPETANKVRLVVSRTTSALIMEDDNDWDLDIKHDLAPGGLIAQAIRSLTGSKGSLSTSKHPYGDKYDLIWLGHCGMRPSEPGPNITIVDHNVLPRADLSVWDGGPFYNGIDEEQRQIRLGHGTICSYAYALTWHAAEKLVPYMQRGGPAFDIELNNACRDVISCIVINPELMHQQIMVGGATSLIGEIDKKNVAKVDSDTTPRPITFNIKYSARCNANRGEGQERIQCLPSVADREVYHA